MVLETIIGVGLLLMIFLVALQRQDARQRAITAVIAIPLLVVAFYLLRKVL